jgi:serine/threonine protein kinase
MPKKKKEDVESLPSIPSSEDEKEDVESLPSILNFSSEQEKRITRKEDVERLLSNISYFGVNEQGNNGWRIENKLGEGGYGEVFGFCYKEEKGEENCDYVMKLVYPSPKHVNTFQENTQKEIEISKLAYELGVSPMLKFSHVENNSYAIMIFEKMDIVYDNTPDGDIIGPVSTLRYASYKENSKRIKKLAGFFFEILATLHKAGIVHMDIHKQNIMFKCEDKSIWKNLKDFEAFQRHYYFSAKNSEDENAVKEAGQEWMDDFLNKLDNGTCVVKFIDYGSSTTKDIVESAPEKAIKFYIIENIESDPITYNGATLFENLKILDVNDLIRVLYDGPDEHFINKLKQIYLKKMEQ